MKVARLTATSAHHLLGSAASRTVTDPAVADPAVADPGAAAPGVSVLADTAFLPCTPYLYGVPVHDSYTLDLYVALVRCSCTLYSTLSQAWPVRRIVVKAGSSTWKVAATVTPVSAGEDGERGRLSKTAVIAEALELADADGLDALTIRKLATHLGVTPMALY